MSYQTQKNARTAGWLYLIVVLCGPFILLYIPGKFFVKGDATATVNNILAHETLFRTYITVELIAGLAFVFVALALYRLFKDVDQQLASIMAVLVLLIAPLGFMSCAIHMATLSFARSAEFLAVFDGPQRNALIMLMLNFDQKGVLVSQVFWGLWLLPLGQLMRRSGFVPRWLSVWIGANGVAYIAMSLSAMMWPQYRQSVFTIATPALFGEMAFMLWLLRAGMRPPSKAAGATLA